MDAKVVD